LDILVGVDLGGTNVKLGCFDERLNLLCKTSAATRADMGPETVVARIVESAQTLLQQNGSSLEAVSAVGIGAPGPADLTEGIIIASPNMPAFRNVPLRGMIEGRFRRPAVLENDANAACWGEFVRGAGANVRDMVFFTLGTGIGGGIIIDGRLVHGCGDAAAELGHMIIHPGGRVCGCGQKGCVEAYASASSTASRAMESVRAGEESGLKDILDKTGEITCRDVYEQLAAGDGLARRITDLTAESLAVACVNMLHCVEPEVIVFSGGMIAAGQLLLDGIRHFFHKHIWSLKAEKVDICFATLGEDAGIIGAAALANEKRRQI